MSSDFSDNLSSFVNMFFVIAAAATFDSDRSSRQEVVHKKISLKIYLHHKWNGRRLWSP